MAHERCAAAAFRTRLAEIGYVAGRNVAVEYRWAEGRSERLPQMAADLVRREVAVIVTPSSPQAALSAKAATATIPIVFSMGGDPIEAGLVTSYNRPSGNITGISSLNTALVAKRIQFIRELVPTAARFALMFNPDSPSAEPQIADGRLAASGQLELLPARTFQDI